MDIKYFPITFITEKEDIEHQISNSVVFSELLKTNKTVKLKDYLESTQYGYTASALQEGTHKFVRITDIKNNGVDWDIVPYCNCDNDAKFLLKENDILITRTGGTIGKSFIVKECPEKSVYASYLIRLRLKEDVNIDFINMFLNSYLFWNQIFDLRAGAAIPNVNAEKLKLLEIPFCTIEEQNEIVSKALFEDKRQNVLKLNHINDSISSEITHQLDLIKDLRQAFLREAMQGVLVSNETQDRATGADLLAEIQADISTSLNGHKKKKPLAAITEDEIPFEIPENWTWCRLDQICDFTNGKAHEQYLDDNGQFILINSKFVSNSGLTRIKYTNYQLTPLIKNDIVIVMSDVPNGRALGRTYLIEKDNIYTLNQRIGALSFSKNINSRFLVTFLNRNIHFLNFDDGKKQTNLKKDQILSCPIFLPPLEIQERIVAKLDELMAVCDALETQVKQSQHSNEQLLQQVLREALGDKKEKAINTEVGVSINKYIEAETNYDTLVAETFDGYLPKKMHNINDIHKELAALVYLMNNGLGINYGNVALQKAVFNSSFITPNLYSKKHDFVNHNYGTFSKELADDLNNNPYLKMKKIGDKEVYEIEQSKKVEILNVLSSPENKDFVSSINRLTNLYSLPLINKETNKMELLNTVLKIHSDLKTTDIKIIYQAMKDWKIKQTGFNTKAEKFSKEDTQQMIELLIASGIL